jgi:hypothetical protein
MIQSACAITAWWCSITVTDYPELTSRTARRQVAVRAGLASPRRTRKGYRGNYIGLAEVVSFIEERMTERRGQGVGETIAKVQARGMPALTEPAECSPSQPPLL